MENNTYDINAVDNSCQLLATEGTVPSARNSGNTYAPRIPDGVGLAVSSPEYGSRRGRTPSRRDFLSPRKALLPPLNPNAVIFDRYVESGEKMGMSLPTSMTLPRARTPGWRRDTGHICGDKAVAGTYSRILPTVNADALLASDPPPVDPVIENFFDTGDKICVIAPSKSKKTFFLTQMACCIAAGIKFLDWDVPKPRRVLSVQLEVKPAHFHRRVKLVCKALGIDEMGGRLEIVNGRGLDITGPLIREAAKRHKAEVVVIDPIYKLQAGDENSSDGWKPILAQFDLLAEETGAAVIYVHHDAKGVSGDRQIQDRGAGSGIVARDYDCGIIITPHQRGGEFRVVDAVKRNYPPSPRITVDWEEGHFQLADIAAVPFTSKSANKNPTSDQPLADFLPDVISCLEQQDSGVLNKGRLIDAIRISTGLTKDRSSQLVGVAVEDEKIITNHGKGLSRKQVLYAIDQAHLDTEIGRLNAITSGKQ